MKPHYFEQDQADRDDMLAMCIKQGYVPKTCLLGGRTVWSEINLGNDPCSGCQGPREKCHGRPLKVKRETRDLLEAYFKKAGIYGFKKGEAH